MSAVADDDHAVAYGTGASATAPKRRCLQISERLHQSKSGDLVISQRVARDCDACIRRKPNVSCFGDQITYGQHQAVVTYNDPIAGPFCSKEESVKRFVRNFRTKLHHGFEHRIKLEAQLVLPGLHFFWKRPVALFCHLSISNCVVCRKASGHVTRFAESVKVHTGCSLGAMAASRIGTFTSAASAANPASRYHMTV